MRENKKYYWLKLKEDFFRDKAIKKLRKIAGGDTYTIIYQKLLLLSLKEEGKLIFDDLEDTFAEAMAIELDEEIENVKMTLLYLEKNKLIEEVEENEFMLPQAVKCIGTETQGAERIRRFRNKEKALQCNAQPLLSNIGVTKCNTDVQNGNTELELELELEKELEKDIVKKQKNVYTQDFETWYGSYPNKFDKPQTFRSWKKLLKTETLENIEAATKKYLKEIKDLETDKKYIIKSSNFIGEKQKYTGYLKEITPQTIKNKVNVVEVPYSE